MKRISVAIFLFIYLVVCASCALQQDKTQLNANDVIIQSRTYSADQHTVHIEIPVFSNSEEPLNRAICAFLESRILLDAGISIDLNDNADVVEHEQQGNDVHINISCRVSMASHEYISIIFEGILNDRRAAHPTHLFFTLNLNRTTGEKMMLSDFCTVDQRLYKIFLHYAYEELKENADSQWLSQINIAELCPESQFIQGLQQETAYWMYMTEASIGISYPVPFSMGNHMEVEIPKEELARGQGDGSVVP